MAHTITTYLTTYQLPTIFFGAFFFGESIILSAAYLAGQQILSLQVVFWVSFLGTVISDLIWFLFGFHFVSRLENHDKHKHNYAKAIRHVDRLVGKRPFLALLFIKFAYGTRVLTIIYLSVKRLSFWKFVFFDSLGTIIWLIVMVSIGWFAGRGAHNFSSSVNHIEYSILGLLILLLGLRFGLKWIQKKIFKE